MGRSAHQQRNLLIVGQFAPDVGYAWDTIGEYFVALGDLFRSHGFRATICYPELDEASRKFSEAGIDVARFDFGRESLGRVYQFVRDRKIGAVYLTDQPLFSARYLACRLAGVRTIAVHDRTSGERDRPGALKRVVKSLIHRYPGFSADVAIAISDFVKRRIVDVACFPEKRVVRIWNGIDVGRFFPAADDYVFREFGIPGDSVVVFTSSRANRYKGVEVLIEAAEILVQREGRRNLFFLFCGDGPDLGRFRALVSEKGLEGRFLCPGKTKEVARILRGASIVVVPSLWQEGFGLSVIEGMGSGKVVFASRVGGIPEIIHDGVDGFLFTAGRSDELASGIAKVLDTPGLQAKIALEARERVVASFNIVDKKRELVALFEERCFQARASRTVVEMQSPEVHR